MTNQGKFERIVIEAVSGGFIVLVETEDDEIKTIFTSPLAATRYIKELLKAQAK